MNKMAGIFFFLIALLLAGAANALAQSGQSVEQIRKQIDDLKSRGENNASWSPAVKNAYEESINALYAIYNKAIDAEIGQLSELLDVVTDQRARKPLEDQIRRLQAARLQPVPAPAAPNNGGVNTAIAARNPGNGSNGAVGPAVPGRAAPGANAGDRFWIEVHAKVKGSGFPVKTAHVKLLVLNPNSESSDYVNAPDFICRNPLDGTDKRCITNNNGDLLLGIRVSNDNFKIAIQEDPYHPYVQPGALTPKEGNDEGEPAHYHAMLTPRDDEYHRAILGFEQTGVSAGNNDQNVFLNFFISRPILKGPYYTEPSRNYCRGERTGGSSRDSAGGRENSSNDDKCVPPKHRFWGDFRITSVPQPRQNLFQALNGSFGSAVNGAIGQMSDLDAGFSFLAGYQYKFLRGSIAGNRFDLSLILGGGASTTLSPEKNGLLYKIPGSEDPERRRLLENKLRKLTDENGVPFDPNLLAGYTDIAFVTKERDRFLRSYYGGFRFETHYGDTAPSRPSGMFDVMFGQDESVTGGRMRGSVLRLDGFFPLPIGKGNLVYLFGTSQLALKRSKTNDPLLLPLADTTNTLTSPTTLVVPVPAANRDLYRIGVGLNLFQVFSTGNANK
jgi:hypothetical protein